MKKMEELHPDQVLEITEVFDAPRERVFKAWTNREYFMAWYGPVGFTTTFCEMEVKVGCTWRACMRSDDGQEYWMQGKYIEIEEPSKLVFTFGDGTIKDRFIDETTVTILFERIDEHKTRMKFKQVNFLNVELRDSHDTGWSSAFICLKEYVEK